jgi:hypothetical protein
MASLSYRGEEWQLTNQRGGQSRVTDRWTDRIKLDLSWGKPLREEKKTAPLKIDYKKEDTTLKVYKDNGAKKTRVTFHNKGVKSSIVLLRVVSLIKLRGMFPTREIKTIEYLR